MQSIAPGWRICDLIRGALRSEKCERTWGRLLEPWDFEPFLREKRKNFTGREWLFKKIDDWRTHGAEPALLIIGEPGIGKSAIVAALVHDNLAGQVLTYHCCRADTPATLATITRPAIANERLKRNRAGDVVLQLKTAYQGRHT